MKLVVFGANGRTGRFVVEEALKRQHHVVAAVRGSHSFTPTDQLSVVEVDVRNADDVDQAVKGVDTVVSVIGHVKKSPAFVQTEGIQHMIKSMQRYGVRRIVSLTGTGVRFKSDIIPWYDYFLNFGIQLIDPRRVEDGRQHVAMLQSSALDWTVLRVLKLQNTAPRAYQLAPHGPTKLFVSREVVAQAILDILESKEFVRQAPILAR